MSENKNIKMTLASGTVIEGMAEELAKLQKLLPTENDADNIEESEESLVGKYVIFSDTTSAELTVGKAYEIEGEDYNSIRVTDDAKRTQYVYKDKQDSRFAYEIVDEIPELQVGDKVKPVIAEGEKPYHGWGGVRNGDVRVVESIHGETITVDFPKQSYWMALRSELVVTDEELAVFNEGDYAKVIGETLYDEFEEGTIVKVISDGVDSDGENNIESLDGITGDYAKPSALEKVELSELDLLFAKNGRKIGEFKEGDIAEVVTSPCADAEGTLVEVTGVDADGIRAKGYRYATGKAAQPYLYTPSHLKLIALAENRADTVA